MPCAYLCSRYEWYLIDVRNYEHRIYKQNAWLHRPLLLVLSSDRVAVFVFTRNKQHRKTRHQSVSCAYVCSVYLIENASSAVIRNSFANHSALIKLCLLPAVSGWSCRRVALWSPLRFKMMFQKNTKKPFRHCNSSNSRTSPKEMAHDIIASKVSREGPPASCSPVLYRSRCLRLALSSAYRCSFRITHFAWGIKGLTTSIWRSSTLVGLRRRWSLRAMQRKHWTWSSRSWARGVMCACAWHAVIDALQGRTLIVGPGRRGYELEHGVEPVESWLVVQDEARHSSSSSSVPRPGTTSVKYVRHDACASRNGS